MRRTAPLLLACYALLACSGETLTEGLSEPIRVAGAQFFEGAVPGLPAGAGQPPLVTSLTLNNRAAYAGQLGKRIEGRATTDAASVALGFAELGSGYWLRPVGAPDVTADNELSWTLPSDFSPGVPPGLRTLLIVAADAQGNFGTQTELELCVLPPVPDNLNTCDPTRLPPHTVLSLSWSEPVDLDLQVVTPSGRIVDAKRPTTAAPVAGEAAPDSAGRLDADSNRACVPDGRQRENLVWTEAPESGTYAVHVSLFDACDQAAVHFQVDTYARVDGQEPDTYATLQTPLGAGSLLALHADGGAELGTFVANFTVE